MDAFDERGDSGAGKPRVLLCDTIKGKGVSYMEKVTEWHSHAIDDAQREIALRELQAHQTAALGSTSA